MPVLLIMGPAGSGKTSLIKTLATYIQSEHVSSPVLTCNLDPGTEDHYEWTLDIRSRFTLRDIIEQENLGPNGAMVRGYERLVQQFDAFFSSLEPLEDPSWLLIDTPGQVEPLLFSASGNALMEKMHDSFPDVTGIFLMPGDMINDPAHYAFLLMVYAGLSLKVPVEIIQVISKADLIDDDVLPCLQDAKALQERLLSQKMGEFTEFGMHATEMMERLIPALHLVFLQVNAEPATGLDDLFDIINELKCGCGDLS